MQLVEELAAYEAESERLSLHAAERQALEELRLLDVRDAAKDDPKFLIHEMRGFDPTLQESFGFTMFPPEGYQYELGGAHGWYWQAEIIDWWMDPEVRIFLMLKARQLGITWLAVALALWHMLYRPGSNCVCYSHGEDEAKKLIARAWLMFKSLPDTLLNGAVVITPSRAELPTEKIVVKFPDGVYSTFQALPSTMKAGHGDTVTFGILDEFARHPYARHTYEAILPGVSRGGRLAIISTPDGVSNPETGTGNFFHRLYATKKEKHLGFRFLPWHLHPERGGAGIEAEGRDPEWYELWAMALDDVERNRQYPLNENDAFMLSGAVYFPAEALAWYRENTVRPLFSGQFFHAGRKGEFVRRPDGVIDVYALPRQGARYGISVDTASGRAQDYTSADVIDLSSGEIVAQLHGKIEIKRAAIQIKLLGHWYRSEAGSAKVIVERTGIGEAMIVALRSSDEGLDPYPNLYRFTRHSRADRPMSDDYGFPMGPGNRAQVLDSLKSALRKLFFPSLPPETVGELQTFVYRETNPSPRAQDGCNDDRVMSLALVVQLLEEHGERPERSLRAKKWRKQQYQPHPARSMK